MLLAIATKTEQVYFKSQSQMPATCRSKPKWAVAVGILPMQGDLLWKQVTCIYAFLVIEHVPLVLTTVSVESRKN